MFRLQYLRWNMILPGEGQHTKIDWRRLLYARSGRKNFSDTHTHTHTHTNTHTNLKKCFWWSYHTSNSSYYEPPPHNEPLSLKWYPSHGPHPMTANQWVWGGGYVSLVNMSVGHIKRGCRGVPWSHFTKKIFAISHFTWKEMSKFTFHVDKKIYCSEDWSFSTFCHLSQNKLMFSA